MIDELTIELKDQLVRWHNSMCQVNQELLLRIQQLKAKHPIGDIAVSWYI